MKQLTRQEIENLTAGILNKRQERALFFNAEMFKREIEEMEFECMMLRKYSCERFYQRARGMSIEELNERHCILLEKLRDFKADYENMRNTYLVSAMNRERVAGSLMPYTGRNLKELEFTQQTIF